MYEGGKKYYDDKSGKACLFFPYLLCLHIHICQLMPNFLWKRRQGKHPPIGHSDRFMSFFTNKIVYNILYLDISRAEFSEMTQITICRTIWGLL